MAKTIEELLQPRYKVIADYPKSPFNVGEFIQYDFEKDGTLDKWPHLFKRLRWWEERSAEEIPDYVKDDNGVYKVSEWHVEIAPKCTVFINPKIHKGYVDDCTECPLYSDIFPATAEEYNEYITKQPQ